MAADPVSQSRRPKAALWFRPELRQWLFPAAAEVELARQVDVVGPAFHDGDWKTQRSKLADVEVLIGSWGLPLLDRGILDAMPRLRVLLYGGGSVRGFVTEEFWRRNIRLSTAASANAVPTAVFAEAMIILALKHTWFYLRERITDWASLSDTASSGVHRATIGVIGLSRVGRLVVSGLQRHEVKILVTDPTVNAAEARQLGVELVDLPTLFAASDVVSLHAPLLTPTTGIIRGDHLRLMKQHATFVNTARGAIVRESELVAVMRERPDLTALLDVTDPEPASPDSPLRKLPNVVITPHLAGARHREIAMIGRLVIDELSRYVAGAPLAHVVDERQVSAMA